MRVRCDAPDGAREIEAESSLDPINEPWTAAGLFPNSQEILLADLTRAKDLWVRLRSHGTKGQSNWSDTAGPWLVR